METSDLNILIKVVQLFDTESGRYLYNWELSKEEREVIDKAREVIKKFTGPSGG